jgi:hypothetical protein
MVLDMRRATGVLFLPFLGIKYTVKASELLRFIDKLNGGKGI